MHKRNLQIIATEISTTFKNIIQPISCEIFHERGMKDLKDMKDMEERNERYDLL